jgi:aldehyde:ferredoxin oxidoreductase
MAFGYNGKILHINLSTGKFKVETPAPEFYRKYLGGSALNCYYLYKTIPVGADPLGPENVLAVSVGVTTGAAVAGQSRVAISAKSPLTGLIGDSQAGGFFPAEMKYAGYDAFLFTGKSPKPVYLRVNDGKYELRDASHLWGKVTGDAEDLIRQELGDERIEIAQIGPAGEHEVRFAAVMNMCNRANGRTGMGAVMGSKNLKAIAVRGKQGRKDFKVAFPEEFRKLAKEGAGRLKGSRQEAFGKLGTAGNVLGQNLTGGLPTNNFVSGEFSEAKNISGELLYDTLLVGHSEGKQDSLGRDTCFACPIRCKRVVEINDGDFTVDKRYGGPEYETIAMLGSACGIGDLKVISKANEFCNKYGLDTISCGGTIAWAMECFEKGIITKKDTGGLDLRFGNVEPFLQIIELIAKREGFGDILALGSARAAEIIGKGSQDLLVIANKQEFPAHLPRVKVSLGINYAINPYGADHMTSGHDPMYEIKPPANDTNTNPSTQTVPPNFIQLGLTSPTTPRSLGPEKMRYTRITQNYASMLDSLCWCMIATGNFGGLFSPNELAEIVNFVTGWDITLEELLVIGERKYNMMRIFNAREGHDKRQDLLPKKMFIPLKGGPSDGLVLDEKEFETAKVEYYRQRGWDEKTGNPTPKKLVELGLEWAVDK